MPSLWKTWYNMIRRCHSYGPAMEHYAVRGITVCLGWRNSLEAFASDMGPKPSEEHSIDRINNNDGYHCGHCEDCLSHGWPSNCRWATRAEQARNKTTSLLVTHQGETRCLAEWARKTGLNYATLRDRFERGDRGAKLFRAAKQARKPRISRTEFGFTSRDIARIRQAFGA